MSVPLWEHVGTVLALLVANALTFHWGQHHIKQLRAALIAKKVLLGGIDVDLPLDSAQSYSQHLVAGDTWSLSFGKTRCEITVSNAVTLTAKAITVV